MSSTVERLGTSDRPGAYADSVIERIVADLLRYVVGSPAVFGFARFNGRRLADNAPEVVFSLATNSAVPTGLRAADVRRSHETFPFVRPVWTRRGPGRPRRHDVVQLGARRDLEDREDRVEVGADGARRQEQPLADLAVGQAGRRQPRDPLLLRGQLAEEVRARSACLMPDARSSIMVRSSEGAAPSRSNSSRAASSMVRASITRRRRRSHSP